MLHVERHALDLALAAAAARSLVPRFRVLGPYPDTRPGRHAACMDKKNASDGVRPGDVVVAVDGSAHSDRAVQWAAHHAHLEGRPLTIVHAAGVGRLRTTTWVDAEESPDSLQEVLAPARQLVHDAAALARAIHPASDIREHPVLGDPRQVLVNASAVAHSVVLGSRGRGVLRSVLLGSVSATVSKHAHCPVVVCRPERPGPKDGVVVGADGTAESLPVIEHAFRQASFAHLPLTVMHCYWGQATPALAGHGGLESHVVADELKVTLSQSVAGLRERFPDVHVTLRLEHGLIDEVLAANPRSWDLVVVGRHPLDSLWQILTGSLSTAVLERSRSTVMVVPQDHPAESSPATTAEGDAVRSVQ